MDKIEPSDRPVDRLGRMEVESLRWGNWVGMSLVLGGYTASE